MLLYVCSNRSLLAFVTNSYYYIIYQLTYMHTYIGMPYHITGYVNIYGRGNSLALNLV